MKRFLVLGLITVLIFTACAPKKAGNAAQSDTPQEGSETAQVYADEVLELAVTPLLSMNPLLVKTASARDFFFCVFDPLFYLNAQGSVDPCLVESYRFSQDATEMTLHLKNGISWHDGTAFSAYDVAYTLDFLRENETLYTQQLRPLVAYTVTDDRTVVLTFSEPCAFFAGRLTFPVIARHNTAIDTAPIGTGPYIYSDKMAHDRYLFVANGAYFRGKPKIDTLYVNVYAKDRTAAAAFTAGDLSVLRGDAVDFDTFAIREVMETVSYPSHQYEFLTFNFQNPLLAGEKIRSAICKTIDRGAIVGDLLFETGVAANLPFLGIEESGVQTADPQAAVQLLEEEGFWLSETENVRIGEAGALRFTLLYNEENKERAASATAIATALSAIGVAVTPQGVPYEAYINRLINGDFELLLGGASLAQNGDLGFLFGAGGILQYCGYASAVMDMRIQGLALAADETQKQTEISRFSEFFKETQPICGLYFKKNVALFRRTTPEHPISGETLYQEINEWQTTAETQ